MKNETRRQMAILAERDNPFQDGTWSCCYCGALLSGPDATDFPERDHVIPLSRGGPNTMNNKVLACRRCNRAKHNRTPEEWMTIEYAAGNGARYE